MGAKDRKVRHTMCQHAARYLSGNLAVATQFIVRGIRPWDQEGLQQLQKKKKKKKNLASHDHRLV
jgi:hypothetical protein